MNGIFITLVILIVLASILLTIVVLLQNGKGGGLASNFVAGNQTFGVRQTADILEKITWGLVAVIFVLAVISAFTTGSSNKADVDVTDKIIEADVPAETPDFQPQTINLDDAAAQSGNE